MRESKGYRIRFEAEAGGSVQFEPSSVQPLGLEELLSAMGPNGGPLPLELAAADALVDGRVVSGRSTIRMPIEFNRRITIFALVEGGWLPPSLIPSPRLLVDRNVISGLAECGRRSPSYDRRRPLWC